MQNSVDFEVERNAERNNLQTENSAKWCLLDIDCLLTQMYLNALTSDLQI